MRSEAWKRLKVAAFVLVGGLVSSAALALPWDLDMVDSQNVKAYERLMAPLPDGVNPQPNLLSPKSYVWVGDQIAMRDPNHSQIDPEVATMHAPFPDSDAARETGGKMYGIYCTPCHGDGTTLGPLAADGKFPKGIIPVLTGPNGRLHTKTDGWIYYTIRNGSFAGAKLVPGVVANTQFMPPYGYMMTETEQWSLVYYLRTLPGSTYDIAPPAPATTPTENPK